MAAVILFRICLNSFQSDGPCVLLALRYALDVFLLAALYVTLFYIAILRWSIGSRRLHHNSTVIRRVTMVRRERGCDYRCVRGDVS